MKKQDVANFAQKVIRDPLKTIFLVAETISVIALFAIVVEILIEIIARTLFGKSVFAVIELAGLALVVITFMSLGWIFAVDGHIRLTLVIDRLSYKMRQVLEFFLGIFSLGFVCVVMYLWWHYVYSSFRVASRLMETGIPVWIPQMIALVGWGILAIALVESIVNKAGELLNAFVPANHRENKPKGNTKETNND